MMNEAHYSKRARLELFEGKLTDHRYPWHYHDCYTVVFVAEGALTYVYTNKKIELKKGQIHVVNPFHSHYNFPVGKCIYKAIFLPAACFQKPGSGNSGLCFQCKAFRNKSLFTQLEALFEKIKHTTKRLSNEALEQQMVQLLKKNLPHEAYHPLTDARITPAFDFIKNNLGNKLTVTAIAASCHLSRFHFQRIFKAYTGLTVNAYIQQLRTELAKQHLSNGKSIGQTSFETGYFDQSHFHKAFKRMWVTKPAKL